jgi:hypothetical protein
MAAHAQGSGEFDSLLAEGKEQFRRGDSLIARWGSDTAETNGALRRAVAALERAVALDDGSQEAHYFLGYAYDRLSGPRPSFGQLEGTLLESTLRVSREMEKAIAISSRYDGEIVILDPRAKITSSWGSLAVAYACTGLIDSARWAFRQGRAAGGFPDPVLITCRNVLRSCGPDAILFSYGDGDTFPVWYVQLVEGYRTDVTLVNIPLADDQEYVKFMRRRYPFGPNTIPLTMSDRALDGLRARRLKSPEHVTISVPAERLKEIGGADPRELRRRSISLVVPGHDDEGGRVKWVKDAIMLDILRANGWRRPVYFFGVLWSDEADALGLGDYLRVEGATQRLLPRKANPRGEIAVAFTDSLLLSELNGLAWLPGNDAIDDEGSRLAQMEPFMLLMLAANYHAQHPNDNLTTRHLLERMEHFMPPTRFGFLYNHNVLDALEYLYGSTGRPGKFREIMEVLEAKQSLLDHDGLGGREDLSAR